jgi:hypothetical protein
MGKGGISMTEPFDPDRDAAERLQLIATGLAAAGLGTRCTNHWPGPI